MRLYLDGKPVIDRWSTSDRLHADGVDVQLQAGRSYDLRLDYFEGERDAPYAWPGANPAPSHRCRKRWTLRAAPTWWSSSAA